MTGCRIVGTLLLPALAALLAACSPTFDWRELRSTQGRFQLLMPARPSQASGNDAAGHPRTLWTAEAGAALFSVGYTDYPDAAQAHLNSARDLLVASARGKLLEQAATLPPQPAGTALTVQAIAADGSERRLQVWLFARDHRLYQLAVASRPGTLPEEQTETFRSSFRLD